MDTRYYKVAGHQFSVSGEEEVFLLMSNYEPFASGEAAVAFSLTTCKGSPVDYEEEMRQEARNRLWTYGCARTDIRV